MRRQKEINEQSESHSAAGTAAATLFRRQSAGFNESTPCLETAEMFLPCSAPDPPLHCFAAVPRGAEELAAAELAASGISDAKPGKGGVAFRHRPGRAVPGQSLAADRQSRTGSAGSLSLFEPGPNCTPECTCNAWQELITPDMTLAVDCSLRDSALTHSGFVALKTKDAIVDRIRESCGSRPECRYDLTGCAHQCPSAQKPLHGQPGQFRRLAGPSRLPAGA